jgi:hypothetical protein
MKKPFKNYQQLPFGDSAFTGSVDGTVGGVIPQLGALAEDMKGNKYILLKGVTGLSENDVVLYDKDYNTVRAIEGAQTGSNFKAIAVYCGTFDNLADSNLKCGYFGIQGTFAAKVGVAVTANAPLFLSATAGILDSAGTTKTPSIVAASTPIGGVADVTLFAQTNTEQGGSGAGGASGIASITGGTINSTAINSSTIDGTIIGGTTPAAGTFTNLTVSGNATFALPVVVPAPVGSTDATNKNYVDNLVTGLGWKNTVRVGTTANITLLGTQTIDGVAVVVGDRVLVKNQTTTTQNGIYLVSAGAWTRTTDADTGAELVNATCLVSEGTTLADTQFTCTTNAPITIGVTALTFAQFSTGGATNLGIGAVTSTVLPITSSTGISANIPAATPLLAGAVTAVPQSFGGDKTFTNRIHANSSDSYIFQSNPNSFPSDQMQKRVDTPLGRFTTEESWARNAAGTAGNRWVWYNDSNGSVTGLGESYQLWGYKTDGSGVNLGFDRFMYLYYQGLNKIIGIDAVQLDVNAIIKIGNASADPNDGKIANGTFGSGLNIIGIDNDGTRKTRIFGDIYQMGASSPVVLEGPTTVKNNINVQGVTLFGDYTGTKPQTRTTNAQGYLVLNSGAGAGGDNRLYLNLDNAADPTAYIVCYTKTGFGTQVSPKRAIDNAGATSLDHYIQRAFNNNTATGSFAVDFSLVADKEYTLTGNTVFTSFTNPSLTASYKSRHTLRINTGAGGFTCGFPAGVIWLTAGGVAPVITTVANKVLYVSLEWNGTDWVATASTNA